MKIKFVFTLEYHKVALFHETKTQSNNLFGLILLKYIMLGWPFGTTTEIHLLDENAGPIAPSRYSASPVSNEYKQLMMNLHPKVNRFGFQLDFSRKGLMQKQL